jgi:hypothetical protein
LGERLTGQAIGVGEGDHEELPENSEPER